MNKFRVFAAVAAIGLALGAFGGILDKISGAASAVSNAVANAVSAAAVDNVTNEQLLEMSRQMYLKDMQTSSGIVKWHGKLTRQVVDTNALIQVVSYADGYTRTNKWTLITPRDAAQSRLRKLSVSTNGIPAKLAAARLKRLQEIKQGVTNVTVTVSPNRPK